MFVSKGLNNFRAVEKVVERFENTIELKENETFKKKHLI